MTHDLDAEPPFDPTEAEEPQEEQEPTSADVAYETTMRVVDALGSLGVPNSVVLESKRREQTANAVSAVIQLGLDEAARDIERQPSQEDKLEIYADRMEDPSLLITVAETYHDDMSRAPSEPAHRLRPKKNFWSAVKEIEPYDHSAVRKIQMAVTADPYTRASTLTAIISFRPTAFGSALGLQRLMELKTIVETQHPNSPGAETTLCKHYIPDDPERGVGVLWQDEKTDRRGKLTTEMSGLDIVISHAYEGKPIERDDQQNPIQTETGNKQLRSRLESHTELLVDDFPQYLEHLAQAWIDEPLPQMQFELVANRRVGEGNLEELHEQEKKQELHEVPSEVTDERQREIYLATIRPRPEITFDMVGGLDEEKTRIRRLVKRAKHPELYASAGINPKPTGLLIGPPGCGKTMLAEAAAHEMDSIFLAAKVSDIESMWAGEAEKNLQALFGLIQTLGETRPVTLFIDEFEGLASSRNSQHMMNWERKITTEFLSALNHQYPNCLILAATNDGGHVDPAISRSGRFSDIIEIEVPDDSGRESIISNWMEHFKSKATARIFEDFDITEVVKATKGLTGADLKTVIENTIGDAVDDAIDTETDLTPVSEKALLNAIDQLQRINILRHQSYI